MMHVEFTLSFIIFKHVLFCIFLTNKLKKYLLAFSGLHICDNKFDNKLTTICTRSELPFLKQNQGSKNNNNQPTTSSSTIHFSSFSLIFSSSTEKKRYKKIKTLLKFQPKKHNNNNKFTRKTIHKIHNLLNQLNTIRRRLKL